MNKIISTLTLSVFLGINGLLANDIDSVESKVTQKLSKTDSEFLFGTEAKNLNVQILSQKELEDARAEFWPMFLLRVGLLNIGVANAPGPDDPTYIGNAWFSGAFWR